MTLDEAVYKLKETGAVKINNGNIWFMKLPDGEEMLALSSPTYHASTIIKDVDQLKTKLHYLLNNAENATEGEICISDEEIRM